MKPLKIVFIAGADTGRRGSIQHEDDFRYYENGVLMTRPIMNEFFSRGGSFDDSEALIARTRAAPRRQIYFSGIFIYSLLTGQGHEVDLVNCLVPDDLTLKDRLTDEVSAICI